jgi:hypothetical protein
MKMLKIASRINDLAAIYRLDFWIQMLYNTAMSESTKPRKKRRDRTHIVYRIDSGTDFYVGVTAKTASTVQRSLAIRWNKHIYRSRDSRYGWLLYNVLRERGAETFRCSIIAVVRGKTEAHALERSLIRDLMPNLNTDTRTRA